MARPVPSRWLCWLVAAGHGAGGLRIEGASCGRDAARERDRRACWARPEAARRGPGAGLEVWAAGLRRLRAEECGTEGPSRAPGASEFVCEEPTRFLRYDFDLMPWAHTSWGLSGLPVGARCCVGRRRLRRWTAASGSSGAGAVLPAGAAWAGAAHSAAATRWPDSSLGRVGRAGEPLIIGTSESWGVDARVGKPGVGCAGASAHPWRGCARAVQPTRARSIRPFMVS